MREEPEMAATLDHDNANVVLTEGIRHYRNPNAESVDMPRVSVIVANYNYAALVPETLDGLLSQTFRDFEVIVVDNASTDGSVEVIRKYVDRDPRFSLYARERNMGLPGSVKLGIEKARGEFVAFCEADDIWMPKHLEKCMDLVAESGNEAHFLITDLEPFGDPQRCKEFGAAKAARWGAFSKKRNRIPPADFRHFNWIFTFSVVMVRRSVLATCDIDSVPRASNLDWWLWRQLALENDIWVVHEKLTKWRLHKQSFTVKDDTPAMIAEGYDMVAKMDHLLVARHPDTAKDIVPFLRPEDDFRCENGTLVDKDGKPANMQPSFSVVLPPDAPEPLRRKTLASLKAQTYRNFELIDGDATAFGEAESSANNDWLLFLHPGDVLRERTLEVLAARAVLQPDADAFYGKTLCTGTERQLGAHTVVGGDIPCLDGIMRPFACIGAFAVRRESPNASAEEAEDTHFPERTAYASLCGAKARVFVDRILLIYDDGIDGRDPDGSDRKRLAKEFTRARLGTENRRSFMRYAFSALFAMLRRDGPMFFVKCARYAFSPTAWKWLAARITPGRNAPNQ